MEKLKIVGVSAAFVKDGKVVWSNGYGYADLERKRPAGPDTIYRIASISKSIGATALMQLWEQGRFGLDDDISGYLGFTVRNPKYPNDPITFRMLLTHTSSITDGSSQGGYGKAINSASPPLLEDLLVPGGKAYSSLTWGSYKPGTVFEYSNFGSGIIACLVEKISGRRFDSYSLNHIFRPLGMNASYDAADIADLSKVAVLYRPAGDGQGFVPNYDYYKDGEKPVSGFEMPLGHNYIGPAGGVRSSVTDLAKFMIAHMNGGVYQGVRILNKDTVDLMHQMHWFGNGLSGLYRQKGLNFHVTDELAGRRLTGHAGESYGLVSDMYFDRDTQTGVIFMTNGGSYNVLGNGYTDLEVSVINLLFDKLAGSQSSRVRNIEFPDGEKNRFSVNGRSIVFQVPADYKVDRVYIPAIAVADALETKIDFDQGSNTLTLTRGETVVRAKPGDPNLYLNGSKVPLESPPYLKDGVLMLPLRKICESFGAEILHDPAVNTTLIKLGEQV